MHHLSKTLAFLLLVTVFASPLAAQGPRPDGPRHEQPAGCHEDGSRIPAPGSSSHSCCQVGHSFAILQRSSTSQLSLQGSRLVEYSQPAVVVAALSDLQSLVAVSGDPPNPPPLRV